MNIELKNASTMNDVLKIINKYYDLDEPLTTMNKGFILMGMQTVIKKTNIKPR
jgi:hypothetical protein